MEQPGRRASPRPHRPRCRRSATHRPWFSVLGSSGTRSPTTRGSRSSLRRRTCWRTRPWHRAYLLFFFSVFFCAPSDLACRDHSFFFFFRGGGGFGSSGQRAHQPRAEGDRQATSRWLRQQHRQPAEPPAEETVGADQPGTTHQPPRHPQPVGPGLFTSNRVLGGGLFLSKKKRKPLGNALNDARMLSSGRQEGFLNYLSGTRAMPGRPTSTRSCRRRRRQSTGWSGHAANRRSRSFSCGLCRCLLFSPRRTSSTASGMSETSCFS